MNHSKKEEKELKIDLIETVELLNSHLGEELFQEVYGELRRNERERQWTFEALTRFWIAVVSENPDSLSALLDQFKREAPGMLPSSSKAALSQRCQDFSWRFFEALSDRLRERLLSKAEPLYHEELSTLKERFPEIRVLDGSGLAEVSRRLDILRPLTGAVLPGRVAAVFDLWRGITRKFIFDPNAASHEAALVPGMLEGIPEKTLILGDRLYGRAGCFAELARRGLYGLARLNRSGGKVEKIQRLSLWQGGGRESIEDWLIRFGGGSPRTPRLNIRLILYRKGKETLELVTDILEPERLSAPEALALYRARWSVERMFYELKCVLHLNHLYCSSPNGVAIQVYTAVLLHTAFKIAQANIARSQGLPPEALSPTKLFRSIARSCLYYAQAEWGWMETLKLNAGVSLIKPDYTQASWASASLAYILVEKKKRPRSKGKPNPPSLWWSFAHIPGGQRYVQI